MRKECFFLYISVFCLLNLVTSAQSPDSASIILERTIAVSANNFEVDNLNNLYFINNNQLLKIDQAQDTIFTYSSLRYGAPSSLDVSNPLKILLFYKNYGIIQLLDRQLAVKYIINLHQLNIFFPAAIALSTDGNSWLFDEQDGKLKKLEINGKVLQQSVDMRQVANALPRPNIIINNNALVYMNDPEQGIFVFDNYATFKNQLLFKGIKSLNVFGNQLIFWKADQLLAYNKLTFSTKAINLPSPDNILQLRVMKDSLYILRKKQLDIYYMH